ncbi:MAG: oxidoreductase [Anaerolineae bacterium]
MKPDPSENQLAGKIFIVTGAASGVGRSIALRCAWLGAKGLVVSDVNNVEGRNTAAQIIEIGRETGAGTQAIYVQADLTLETACREIVKVCDETFGQVDGVVNAAGRGTRGNLENTSVNLWNEMMNLHVRAPFLLTQDASTLMRREKTAGCMINIGSINAHGGDTEIMAYSVAKGALMTFTKSAALSLRQDHIRMYCINIGWTATEQEHTIQTETGQPENWLEAADQSMPFGRMSRPADIAPLVTFLLTDQAQMATGSIIEWDQKLVLGPYSRPSSA